MGSSKSTAPRLSQAVSHKNTYSHCCGGVQNEDSSPWTVEMAQQVKVGPTLAWNLSLIPSTPVRHLTSACNSRPAGSNNSVLLGHSCA